jgi:IS30 family transposase
VKQKGYSQTKIAEVIGKNKSVVSRELRRNCDKRSGEYRSDLAQRKYEQRQLQKPKKVVFTKEIKTQVSLKLEQKYSPEQITGEAKKNGSFCVSHESIYQYIWEDKRRGGDLHKNLRTQGKRYRKRGNNKDKRGIIKDRIEIEQRPKEVELRERIGDLEIDTIIGQNHKGAILTINDRAAGIVKIKKLEGKDAEKLAAAAIEVLQDWKPFLKTITADNGKEFAEHQVISKALEISFFFAHPYHSWERGSNENLNGLIRQYIPKKTDFSTITDEYIQFVENEINNRPRKRFKYESPNYIFNMKKVAFIT